jgi:hypothetical protein
MSLRAEKATCQHRVIDQRFGNPDIREFIKSRAIFRD